MQEILAADLWCSITYMISLLLNHDIPFEDSQFSIMHSPTARDTKYVADFLFSLCLQDNYFDIG